MTIENYMIPCLNKTLFGFECMGCGLQRSLIALFQGNFTNALLLYPAIYPLILLFMLISLSLIYKFKFCQKVINLFSVISIVIIISNYLIKNLLL